MQYARLLGGGATLVAFARNDDKLAAARENGAHHTVNTRGKSADAVQNELEELPGRRDVDAVLDCAGAEESSALGFAVLGREGALTSVGLIGDVLGQLQRSDRGPRPRGPGIDQAQHRPDQFRRHQRYAGGTGPRRQRRPCGRRFRLSFNAAAQRSHEVNQPIGEKGRTVSDIGLLGCERKCSTNKENMMASPTTLPTPYFQRVELVAETIKTHSKLDDTAASELAVHILHALNSIPENLR